MQPATLYSHRVPFQMKVCLLFLPPGDSVALDVGTVHQGDKFLRYNLSLLGYGYYGDCILESEATRWMGPRRYDWLGRSIACVDICQLCASVCVGICVGMHVDASAYVHVCYDNIVIKYM